MDWGERHGRQHGVSIDEPWQEEEERNAMHRRDPPEKPNRARSGDPAPHACHCERPMTVYNILVLVISEGG